MNTRIPFLYTSLLYICAFVLFLEWLYPVQEIGDVTNLTVFILYTLFCFSLSMLDVKWWISFPLKGIGMLVIIDALFVPASFLSGAWFERVSMEIGFNVHALFSQQWFELTSMFRSVLFLIMIWMLSYLLYYWFIVMKRIFVFILLTFIYLSVLDTFTTYDADAAIVRTFVVSFVALGMTNFFKMIDGESLRFSWFKKTPMWAVPLAVMVMFAVLVGYAAPKFDPQWPDPVPFIRSAADNAGGPGAGSAIQKVGYGNDDSRLGGGFVQDYSVIFQAVAKNDHYWRVETKDVYTGKGWEKSSEPSFKPQQNGNISLKTFQNSVETEQWTDTVSFQGDKSLKKLVYPYGIKQAEMPKDLTLLLDSTYGEIRPERNGEAANPAKYSVTYEKPSFAIDKLREVRGGNSDLPEGLQERYTQLPASLPDRVGELAEEITSDDGNRYDKARSIETYFGRSGFTYQIKNVPVPKEDQDYVDQFLFDSQKGYCDNYSTSMVVMLRSLDIPARWVKGFTSGEVIQSGDSTDDYDVYEITNANAHSWVEAYFPGSGWVPFEPTQGFSNLADFHMNIDETEQDDAPDAPETEAPENQPEETPEEDTTKDTTPEKESNSASFDINWWYVLAGAGVLLLFSFIVYKMRFRWKTVYLFRKLQRNNDAKTFQEAYHYLLKVLSHQGLAKKPDQTLREFSKQIDSRYNTDAMNQLTRNYERVLYKNELNLDPADELPELWKQLMRQITT
ncbi:hypothetical protein FH966_07495 [Lentibacillus cibarius]|uniref:Transglutaminase-like domain-containing protein n=1 Tax=Lentibacillus cibarius TaxID=2583219 RepID=A0A549YI44_9BACI|nr:transglutaminaseTgpA domain-containing protein [Lentibacillus cibarius]TRM11553.1 hypothetical protein FH966_07495 [Lentibacillus cibarius]